MAADGGAGTTADIGSRAVQLLHYLGIAGSKQCGAEFHNRSTEGAAKEIPTNRKPDIGQDGEPA